ncbi:hypothetical protein ES705_10422 [subsurface metagenome]
MNTHITISNIDQTIIDRLQLEAKKNGKDLNSYLVYLLKSSVGLEKIEEKKEKYNDLDFLAGTWSKDEYDIFISNISGFRQIDDELWK